MTERNEVATALSADVLVVGGGIAGMTAAIEAAEAGRTVILIEKSPSLGGAVARMNQYFPKLCPPLCGMEINYRRLRANGNVRVFTQAEVETVGGATGRYWVGIRLAPRYVDEKCTACGECAKVCEIRRKNEHNWGMDDTTAIYLPHELAYPYRYVIDPVHVNDPRMKACVDACAYGAIDLTMPSRAVTADVGAIIWATGWTPYDATRIENLGFGRVPNVITNVMMERLAAADGPTGGKIVRVSDGAPVSSVAFVQCAGSRDDNHLPYCSAVCCMATLKQATYVRAQYPDADIYVFYIDLRTPGRLEDFLQQSQRDSKLHLIRGKVAKITPADGTGEVTLEAEDTLRGTIHRVTVGLAVLATGMVPAPAVRQIPVDLSLDDYGFIVNNGDCGMVGAGTAVRPEEVAAAVQDATGAAMKALIAAAGGGH